MKVAVVGLGFAGLRTIQLLESQGIACVGFEARDRVGGRCYTVREGDLVYEAGGEWIDGDHRRVIDLAHMHGMPLVGHSIGPRWYWFGHDRCTSNNLWPEAAEDLASLEVAAVQAIRGQLPIVDQALQQFINRFATTPRSQWYLSAIFRSDEGDDPSVIGLEGWFRGYENYLDRTGDELSSLRFNQGSSRLLEAMRAQISGPLNLAFPVNILERSPDGWLVEGERFDHVVLTAPPSTYSKMTITPGLPAATVNVISSLTMSRAIKVAFSFREAWWRDLGWDGSL